MHFAAKALLLVLLIWNSEQLSSPIGITPNRKFINSGVHSISTTYTYNNSTAANWSPQTYNITYQKNLQDFKQLMVILSVHQLQANLQQGKLDFNFYGELLKSNFFILYVQSSFTKGIQALSVRYIVAINQYGGFNSNMLAFTYSCKFNGNISSNSFIICLFIQEYNLNMTGGYQMLLAVRGYNFITTTKPTNFVNLQVIGQLCQLASLTKIYVFNYSNESIYVKTIHVNFFIFNTASYNKPKFAQFRVNTRMMNSQNTYTYTNTSYTYQPSTIIGLTHIIIKDESFINFKIKFNSPDSFQVITTNNQNAKFFINYMHFLTYYCSYLTPYYYGNQICYDTCPSERYYNNDKDLTCNACSYDCYTCTKITECLTCNSTHYYRVPSNQTVMRCVPMDGYYESYTSVCFKCSLDCFSCINGNSCQSCNKITQHREMNYQNSRCIPIMGYYESGTKDASKCRFDCMSCENDKKCLSCDLKKHRVLDEQTGRCKPVAGYYQSNKSVSQACRSECLQCQSQSICSGCRQGYFLTNNKLCLRYSEVNSNQPPSPPPTKIIVGCTIGGIFLVSIGILACKCWKRPPSNVAVAHNVIVDQRINANRTQRGQALKIEPIIQPQFGSNISLNDNNTHDTDQNNQDGAIQQSASNIHVR